ncbi:DUF6207 family protein [Streptomyces griseoloalbus]|uniref:DUF6207 family protein n=1 Tax=Streptomyces griseoloalbus TaxID=67303 RepID=A0ABV3E5L2_9ACTN
MLVGRWATSTAERTTHDVYQPGVRLRCYLDLHQLISPATVPADAVPEVSTAAP